MNLARLKKCDPQRFQHAKFIHPVMVPEPVIFGSNDGIDKIFGYPIDGNRFTAANHHETVTRRSKDFGGWCFNDAAQWIRNPGKILCNDKQQAHQA